MDSQRISGGDRVRVRYSTSGTDEEENEIGNAMHALPAPIRIPLFELWEEFRGCIGMGDIRPMIVKVRRYLVRRGLSPEAALKALEEILSSNLSEVRTGDQLMQMFEGKLNSQLTKQKAALPAAKEPPFVAPSPELREQFADRGRGTKGVGSMPPKENDR